MFKTIKQTITDIQSLRNTADELLGQVQKLCGTQLALIQLKKAQREGPLTILQLSGDISTQGSEKRYTLGRKIFGEEMINIRVDFPLQNAVLSVVHGPGILEYVKLGTECKSEGPCLIVNCGLVRPEHCLIVKVVLE